MVATPPLSETTGVDSGNNPQLGDTPGDSSRDNTRVGAATGDQRDCQPPAPQYNR